MPDLFDYWNVDRTLDTAYAVVSSDALRGCENTQNLETIRTSRQYLYKLLLKHQNKDLIAILTELVIYLNTLIDNAFYEKLDILFGYFKQTVNLNIHSDESVLRQLVLYFHPVQAARRAIVYLDRSSYSYHGELELHLAMMMYWAEANDSETFVSTYVAGNIREDINHDELEIKSHELYNDTLHNPMDYQKLCEYGFALLKLGFEEEAIQYFDQSLLINEFYAQAYNGRGMAYAELADQARADEKIVKLQEIEADILAELEQTGLNEPAIADINERLVSIQDEILRARQQRVRIAQYSQLSRNDFIREHIELKKTAYVYALYEGWRGGNFNTDLVNTFAVDNFRQDHSVCENGRINKQAEYFAPFESAANSATVHVTFDLASELYKVMVTQVFKSYQRIHMTNGVVTQNAPSLESYCQLLKNYYTCEKNGVPFEGSSDVEAIIAQEFAIIWRNIYRIFHGYRNANNSAGLLNQNEVNFLDGLAQSLENLTELEELGQIQTAAQYNKFNQIATREFNFSPNLAEIPVQIVINVKNKVWDRFRNEVLLCLPQLHLHDSPAFDYTEISLLSRSSSPQQNLAGNYWQNNRSILSRINAANLADAARQQQPVLGHITVGTPLTRTQITDITTTTYFPEYMDNDWRLTLMPPASAEAQQVRAQLEERRRTISARIAQRINVSTEELQNLMQEEERISWILGFGDEGILNILRPHGSQVVNNYMEPRSAQIFVPRYSNIALRNREIVAHNNSDLDQRTNQIVAPYDSDVAQRLNNQYVSTADNLPTRQTSAYGQNITSNDNKNARLATIRRRRSNL
jgi:hypothetical protein